MFYELFSQGSDYSINSLLIYFLKTHQVQVGTAFCLLVGSVLTQVLTITVVLFMRRAFIVIRKSFIFNLVQIGHGQKVDS